MSTGANGVSRRTYLKSSGAVATFGVAALAGCTGDGGDGGNGDGGGDGNGGSAGGSQSEDAIVIGNAAPLSGNIAPWGLEHQKGLEFAAQEINQDGGVLGQDIEIVSQDMEGDPEATATAVQRLVDREGAVAITGPVLSDTAIRARQVAEDVQVPLLPNQGSSPQLLTKDTRYTFRVAGGAAPTFAAATAQFIEDEGLTNYAAIIADYSYGHDYQAGVEEFILPIEGLESEVHVAPVGADDFTSQLRQVPEDVEYLDVGGHPIGIFTIVRQAGELGLEPRAMAGPNIPTPLFYETLGDRVGDGLMLYPPLDVTSEEYVEVGNRFYEATDDFFDMFVSFGYVTVNLLAQAIEDAGDAEPDAIRDALSEIEYETLFSAPISYTEWGELEQLVLVATEFTTEAPEYYPGGNYSFNTLFETEPFDPIDPEDWA